MQAAKIKKYNELAKSSSPCSFFLKPYLWMNELLKPQECCGRVLFHRFYLYFSHEHNKEGSNCTHFFVIGENSRDHRCKYVKLVDLD
jgi:hypothetical protein